MVAWLVAAGGARTWATRQTRQPSLRARPVAQSALTTLTLANADHVQARTLVAVPVVYCDMDDLAQWMRRRWAGARAAG